MWSTKSASAYRAGPNSKTSSRLAGRRRLVEDLLGEDGERTFLADVHVRLGFRVRSCHAVRPPSTCSLTIDRTGWYTSTSTSTGTCVLHIAHESHVGGPLALVRGGGEIELDVSGSVLTMHVSDHELNERRAAWTPPAPPYLRGYVSPFARHGTHAHLGCVFGTLEAGPATPEPAIH